MMLYDTIKNEGAMQKVAVTMGELLGLGGSTGGGIGALTNDGNRAAGALGGAIGSPLAMLAGLNITDKLRVPDGSAALPITALASLLAGGYGGGKLGAYLDRKTGNNLTKWTNKLLGRGEGAMQKGASVGDALWGAGIGALTNKDHRVAGALGGAAGGTVGSNLGLSAGAYLAGRVPALSNLWMKHPFMYLYGSGLAGNLGGSYLGGKLGAGLSSLFGFGKKPEGGGGEPQQ